MKQPLIYPTPKDKWEAIDTLIERDALLFEAYFILLSIHENRFEKDHHYYRIAKFLDNIILPKTEKA